MIKFTLIIDDLDDHLAALEDPPGFLVVGMLEDALAAAFLQTQVDVHVVTGSLKNSGTTESDFDGSEWEGSITYGGPSPGFPNDPVEYAEYEYARGDDHDFLRNVHLVDELFEAAILTHFGADD